MRETIIYTTKRLTLGLVAIGLASVLISTLIFVVPVDPARMTFGQRLDDQTLELTKIKYGLDKDLSAQLGFYLRDISPLNIISESDPIIEDYHVLLKADIGNKNLLLKWPYLRQSYQSGRDVTDILKEAIPLTIILAFFSILIATPAGIILGILASLKIHTWIDQILLSISILGYSIPSYVSALIFSIVFGYWLAPWTGLPLQGSLIELDMQGQEVWKWHHVILPACALGIRPIAVIMQITRSSMTEELSKNYIKMATAKGLLKRDVVFGHALRNAANPITTTVTGWFAALLAGSFFVESIFNYEGIGKVTVNALLLFDVPVLLGAILSVSCIYVVINILTDLLYRAIDVRVGLEG